MRRLSISAAATLAVVSALPGPVGAAPPTFDGSLSFPVIEGPSDPEAYSWEVVLGEGQELKSIDDRHAAVYYDDEHIASSITAEPAHDASGSSVPTSLAVSAGNVLTLTVHHREGNPLAEGQPFDYPVTQGQGWVEIGGGTVVVAPLDDDEWRKLREQIERANTAAQLPPMPPSPRCHVPDLSGRSLRASRRLLRNAHCTVRQVGTRKGATARTGRVVKQSPRPGATRAKGAGVSVVLGQAG